MLRSSSLALLLLLTACGSPSPAIDAGADASTGPDAGGLDAGGFDAGYLDSGTVDSGYVDAGATDGGSFDAGQLLTVVRVHYPAGTRTVAMRGSAYPFSWAVGSPMTLGADDTWTFTTPLATGTLEFKPLLDDTNWSRGPNYTVQAGTAVDIYPHFFTANGQWSKRWGAFSSTLMGNTRPVWVYLPPTYVENARARFPVVYMHDGQNLFDPSVAFGGNPWWAQNAIDAAAENGNFREAIIVGPEATADRIGEYTPTADPSYGGGKGLLYVRMLVEELKPKADSELRTMPEREHTVIIGSSLGGLISSYAGTVKATTFGMIGAMSPSTWWDGKVLLTLVAATPASPRPLRVYVDSGDSGASSDDKANTAQLAQAYRTLGYSEPATLKYVVQAGATHSEVYWAQRLPEAFKFLLGPRQ
ncbi:MAG: esterase family protein [Myxococcaceae bacterium]|nr:esterase family protein [Myxococcaceae bacterium]